LRQILTNLIGNAVKFTRAGEVVLSVDVVSVTRHDVRVRFEVRDTGPGIDAVVQSRLFNAFAQADTSTTRTFGGTGLGLAISKQLVQMMDGDIGVDSVAGQGATFWFTARFEKQAGADAVEPDVSSLSGRRMLLIEPNATHREILRRQLAGWNVEVDAAAEVRDATCALQAAKEMRGYDVVLMAAQLFSADDGSLQSAMRTQPAFRDARIVGLTPIGAVLSGVAAPIAGFDACVAKPMRQARLFDALISVLQRPAKDASGAGNQGLPLPDLRLPPELAGARILLAEDNEVNRRVALGQLRMLGCNATTVTNGREVLATLERVAYDIILMDCQMPEMDGYEATEKIREWENDTKRSRKWEAPLYIVAMTAHAIDGDREKCLAVGMDNYVTKPVLVAGLRNALQQWKPVRAREDQLVA
jgi:CheY-like chemotaxis protein